MKKQFKETVPVEFIVEKYIPILKSKLDRYFVKDCFDIKAINNCEILIETDWFESHITFIFANINILKFNRFIIELFHMHNIPTTKSSRIIDEEILYTLAHTSLDLMIALAFIPLNSGMLYISNLNRKELNLYQEYSCNVEEAFETRIFMIKKEEENKFVQILNDKFISNKKSNVNKGEENMNPINADLANLASAANTIIVDKYLQTLIKNVNAIKDNLFKISPVKIDYEKGILKIRISSTNKVNKNDPFDLAILFDLDKLSIMNIHDRIKEKVIPYIHADKTEYFWDEFYKIFIDCINIAIVEYSNPYIIYNNHDSNKLIYKDFIIKSLFDSIMNGKDNRRMVLEQIKEANWYKVNTVCIGNDIYEFGKNCFEAYISVTGLIIALTKDYVIVYALSPLSSPVKTLLESSILSFKHNTDTSMIPDISSNIEHATINIHSIRIGQTSNTILYSDKNFRIKYEDALNSEIIKIMRALNM